MTTVCSKPTGKYVRRLWFFYEFLTGKILPLDDLNRGNYIDLLEPDAYYTVESARKVRRQRINNNLPGERRFCPTIRRTDILRDFETKALQYQMPASRVSIRARIVETRAQLPVHQGNEICLMKSNASPLPQPEPNAS